MIRIQSFWRNLFTLLMLCGVTAAWAADYVITYNGNFLGYSGSALQNYTTFNPATCIWEGTSGGQFKLKGGTGNCYLRYNNGLTNSSQTNGSNWTISDGGYVYYSTTSWGTTPNYYIRYNNNSWGAGNNTSNRATAYEVTSSITATGIEVSSITGDATVTSTSTYSASVVQKNNTQYTWNGSVRATVPADDTAVSGATLTWSVSTNEYATMSNGTLTVSSQPTTTTEVTISVTASYNSMTSPAATKTVKVLGTTPSKPTIEVSLNEVTIESELDTDKIYYTLDGSDPSNASNSNREEYVGEFSLTDEMTFPLTIKAVAYRGSNASSVSTEEVTKMQEITSGTVGKKVVLNDWEDIDNWTYYTGVDESVDGGNYNTNYLGKLYSPGARNIIIEYQGGSVNNASEVAISAESGENQNTMIYYQTVEQGATAGEYPYTVIPNPFSKRPRTNNTTGTNGFWGFGGWKLKEGAEYVKGKNTNDVLGLEEDIVFENIPEGTHPKIVFEATWVAATVKVGTSAQSFTGGTYETNFWVLDGGAGNNAFSNLNQNMTISARYPDGTSSTTTASQQGISVSNTFTGTVKFEWISFNTTSNINAGGRNLYIGRGVTNSNNRGNEYIYGCNTASTDVNQTVRVESGKYQHFYHYATAPSSIAKQIVIFGCDYDRAKADNSKLNITGICKISSSLNFRLSDSKTMLTQTYSKSGQIMSSISVGGANTDNVYYFSPDGGQQSYNGGCRYLEIQGGEWCCIAGGFDYYHQQDDPAFTFRMKGGKIRGSVYGAGEYYSASGVRVYVITGGEINGWLAGGANGTRETGGGVLDGTTYIYVGGNARIDSHGSETAINKSVGGNVYGAGCGYSATTTPGQVTLGTNVVVADNAYVERGVYGGGGFGYCDPSKTANVYVTGGTVNAGIGVYNGSRYDGTFVGGVFGGASMNKGGSANIYMTGGTVKHGVYGGSNMSGDLDGSTNIKVVGGTVGTDANTTAYVCGGGYGSSTNVKQKVEVTIGDATSHRGPNIYGDVYGGSQMGKTNTSATTAALRNTYSTTVAMNGGRVYGDIYGGGFGENGNAADVSGNVTVNVTGGTVWGVNDEEHGGVYGGNNLNGTPKGTITVNVSGSDAAPADNSRLAAIRNVFGGGNKAAYTGNPAVNISGGHTHYVFGGAQEANINGNSHVNVTGGKANNIFGGNYKAGTISGTITVDINWTDTNWRSKTSNTDFVGNVYGGGYLAAYSGNPVVNFINGRSQKVNGDIIGSVYGGGYGLSAEGKTGAALTEAQNAAVIEGKPTVTIGDWDNNHKVTIAGNVFGGGALAAVEGDPTVTVNDCDTEIGGDVYGGGDAAPVYSTTTTIWGGTIKGNVFGGGNGKDATKNSKGAQVGYSRDDTTTAGTGNTNTKIYGGTFGIWDGAPATCAANTGGIFGGSNMNGNIRGKINLFVGTPDATTTLPTGLTLDNICSFHINELYGAGNEAAYVGTGGVDCELGCVSGIDYIYGGAKNCDFTGDVDLKLTNGRFKAVFGGNNLGGNLNGTIKVTIDETGCQPLEIGELYGGGDQAAYTGSPVVNVYSCSYIGNIYGAGKGDPTDNTHTKGMVTGNPVVNIYQIPGKFVPGTVTNGVYTWATSEDATNETGDKRLGYIGNIFGGGNAAKVDGNTTVNIATAVTGVTTVGTGADDGKLQVAHPTGTDQTTKVNIGANIIGNVYGGGNEADVTGKTTVNIGKK